MKKKKMFSIDMQDKGGGEKWKYTWREADVPLVGCFANDTENRFTAGIDNNSEEIKKVTGVTIFHSSAVEDGGCFNLDRGPGERHSGALGRTAKDFATVVPTARHC